MEDDRSEYQQNSFVSSTTPKLLKQIPYDKRGSTQSNFLIKHANLQSPCNTIDVDEVRLAHSHNVK